MIKTRHLLLAFLLSGGIFILLTSCAGGDAPAEVEPTSVSVQEPALTAPALPTATHSLPAATQAVTAVPSIPEQRRLTLEYPPTIRAGDADIVRLTLEVDDLGNITPTAQIDDNVVTGETIEIENLYDTHHVLAQAEFTMAGLEIVPPGAVNEPLLPGKPVTFYWSVRPEKEGEYRGTVWLRLIFTPKEGGESLPRTISAQFIEINATTFMGLDAETARWAGAIGSFISGVLGLPFFEEIVKWLWAKRKKKA